MSTDNLPDIKSIIIALREERGWNAAELARRSGLTQPALSYIEKGERQPGFDTLAKIARAFGMDLIELLSYRSKISNESSNTRSELIRWMLQPENMPYLEFARRIAEKVSVDELKHLEIRKTFHVDINIDNSNEERSK